MNVLRIAPCTGAIPLTCDACKKEITQEYFQGELNYRPFATANMCRWCSHRWFDKPSVWCWKVEDTFHVVQIISIHNLNREKVSRGAAESMRLVTKPDYIEPVMVKINGDVVTNKYRLAALTARQQEHVHAVVLE